jgi:PPOX class probable FMN-dependent enzyme
MRQEYQFEEIIGSRQRLREIIKEPSRFVSDKVISHIDDYCRRFIAASPFAIIATRSRAGAVDLSPKGDPPGFVQVLDDRTLAIPDRPGNNRVDTLCNLTEDSRIGTIFLIPGKSETLRISGRGMIVRDATLGERLAYNGKPPTLAIVIKVERAFFHCSKCMIRSSLWKPDHWPETRGLPTLAETMVRHGKLLDTVGEVDEIVRRDAANRLY